YVSSYRDRLREAIESDLERLSGGIEPPAPRPELHEVDIPPERTDRSERTDRPERTAGSDRSDRAPDPERERGREPARTSTPEPASEPMPASPTAASPRP